MSSMQVEPSISPQKNPHSGPEDSFFLSFSRIGCTLFQLEIWSALYIYHIQAIYPCQGTSTRMLLFLPISRRDLLLRNSGRWQASSSLKQSIADINSLTYALAPSVSKSVALLLAFWSVRAGFLCSILPAQVTESQIQQPQHTFITNAMHTIQITYIIHTVYKCRLQA